MSSETMSSDTTSSETTTNKKAMVAGHICLDITPSILLNGSARQLSDVLAPGRLLNVGGADIHTGGAVSNTGLALNRLGVNVVLVGKVGSDQFGGIIKNILARHGCDGGLIVSGSVDTSYSVVIAAPGIDRVFLHNPGANHTFCSDDIPDEAFDGVDHFHFGYPPLMRVMYQNEGSELVKLLVRAKKAGATTSVDMAAVDPDSDAGKVDWGRVLASCLPYIDIFMPSIEELGFMLDRTLLSDWHARANGDDITRFIDIGRDVPPLADRLLAMGASMLVIKCGVRGIYFKTTDTAAMRALCARQRLDAAQWTDKSGFETSYHQPVVVSATGAGDASIAGFLAAMLKGRSLDRCIKLAAAAGACSVSAADALSGLMPLDELESRIDAGWEKAPSP